MMRNRRHSPFHQSERVAELAFGLNANGLAWITRPPNFEADFDLAQQRK